MFYRVVVISLRGRGRSLPLAGEPRVIFQEIVVALLIKKMKGEVITLSAVSL